jgi:hypothetical protein
MDKEETLINSQIAIFFKDNLKPEDFFGEINSKFSGLFDGQPTILPVPQDERFKEVPVVVLTSQDDVYKCNFSRGRIDLLIAGEGEEKFANKKDIIKKHAETLYDFCTEKEIAIKRIGFVTRLFIKNENKERVVENILNEDFMDLHKIGEGRFIEGSIKYVRRIDVLNLQVNNYTTIEGFDANIGGETNIPGFLLTRDFNTGQELDFSKSASNFSMKNFIEEAEKHFKIEEIKKLLCR